jgi:hypothetical protein
LKDSIILLLELLLEQEPLRLLEPPHLLHLLF